MTRDGDAVAGRVGPLWPMAGAIGVEVTATLLLKASAGFTRPVLGILALGGFVLALWLLAAALHRLPISVAYAVWMGAGSVVVSVAGFVLFGEHLTRPAIAGIALVVLGVALVNSGPR